MPVSDDAALERAYLDALYIAHAPRGEIVIKPGQPAAEVEQGWDAGCYGFITAWNPASVQREPTANRDADAALVADLAGHGLRTVAARASDPEGRWHEPGWLVLDATAVLLHSLGRRYGQAGVLFWTRGASVRLHMLRTRPSDAAASAWTDWIE